MCSCNLSSTALQSYHIMVPKIYIRFRFPSYQYCYRQKHKQTNKPSTLLLASFLRILAGTSPSLSAVKLQTYLQFLSCFLLDTKYTTSPFFTERWSLSLDLKSSSTTKRSLFRCKQHKCKCQSRNDSRASVNTFAHHATTECMKPPVTLRTGTVSF